MLYQTERLEQLEILEWQYLAEDLELRSAGGFEPATHGFGVGLKLHKVLKMLAFSPVSTYFSHKTVCRGYV